MADSDEDQNFGYDACCKAFDGSGSNKGSGGGGGGSSGKDGVDNDEDDNDGEDSGSGGNGGRCIHDGRGTSSSDVDYGGDDSNCRGIGDGDDDQTTLSTMATVAAKMVEAATTAVPAVAVRTASAKDVVIWVACYVSETAGV